MARRSGRGQFRAALACSALAAVLSGACSGEGDGGASAPTTTPITTRTTAVPDATAAPAPAPSPEEALQALLAAEQKGDHAAAYLRLSSAARKDLDASRWARRRAELPAVKGFRIEGVEDGVVTAVVEHEPGLDPFVGLRPGAERQRWKARKEAGGWLLDPEPAVKPLYPPAEAAGGAALAWVRAVQACDQEAASALQGVTRLFGSAAGVTGLCRSPATPAAGPPERLPAGFASQEIVAQYGPETFEWARAVRISAVERSFHVVLAPIGSVWKVIGVYEP